MSNKKFQGWTYKWTQPYPSMNQMYGYDLLKKMKHYEDIERELDRLDAIDIVIDNMTEYPDAKEIMENLKHD